MLKLTRNVGQSVYIGKDIQLTIFEVRGNQVRLGIQAPKEVRIFREELLKRIDWSLVEAVE